MRTYWKNFWIVFSLLWGFLLAAEEKTPYIILSIDGGGSRGIIPSTFISCLEKSVGAPAGELFHCISGVSTGGIIAIALTKPSPLDPNKAYFWAKDLVHFYLVDAPAIFSPPFYEKAKTLWGLIGPKYSTEALKKILAQKFEGYKIKDSLTDLIVTSYNLETNEGFYFKHFSGVQCEATALDAALATSAAPTFFSPEIFKDQQGVHVLADGGILCTDPTAITFREALRHISLKDREVFVLSIGCGKRVNEPLDPNKVENWGLIKYASPLIDDFFEASKFDAEQSMQTFAKLFKVDYTRVNIHLHSGEEALDISDVAILERLRKRTETYYEEVFAHSETGKKLLKLLQKRNYS